MFQTALKIDYSSIDELKIYITILYSNQLFKFHVNFLHQNLSRPLRSL